jgi:aspartyl-tRNA(Asn)/glutamyl-tRNA(Gln) amidotransferase subunit A
MSFTLDHVGPLTRTVEDSALLLQAIAGHDANDHTSLPSPVDDFRRELDGGVRGLRIGVDRSYFFYEHVADDVRTASLEAIDELERQGAEIVDVAIDELDLITGAGFILVLVDTANHHRRLIRKHSANYDPATRLMIELGELISATDYLTAQRARHAMCRGMRQAFEQHGLHALAAPTIPTTTMPLEALSVALGADVTETALSSFLHHNIPANLTGQPALSVPCGFSSEDLPIGLQLIGRPLEEAVVYRIARAYERACPWHERAPEIPHAREAVAPSS